jgi:Arylsulfotransferase (ASST)
MLSLRNLNLVMVIDPATEAVRWTQTGPWIRQHDPDFLPDGRIMIFDNRRDESGKQVFGGSRILTIDPVTRDVQTLYEGSKEAPFFSNVKGKQQLLANGDVLITEAERGRTFEVAPNGRMVWSYISRFDDHHVAKISDSKRYSENYADFEVQRCLEDGS